MIASSIINYPAQLRSTTPKVWEKGNQFNNVDIPGTEYYLREQQKNNIKKKID